MAGSRIQHVFGSSPILAKLIMFSGHEAATSLPAVSVTVQASTAALRLPCPCKLLAWETLLKQRANLLSVPSYSLFGLLRSSRGWLVLWMPEGLRLAGDGWETIGHTRLRCSHCKLSWREPSRFLGADRQFVRCRGEGAYIYFCLDCILSGLSHSRLWDHEPSYVEISLAEIQRLRKLSTQQQAEIEALKQRHRQGLLRGAWFPVPGLTPSEEFSPYQGVRLLEVVWNVDPLVPLLSPTFS